MMIDETQLSYQRGTLVEFRLTLGGGPKRCRGLVLNTAVLMGKAARQVWILDMDDATPELTTQWTKKKYIVPEGEIIAIIPQVVIGGDTLLRDNPVCYPVRDLNGERETAAVEVTGPLPVSTPNTEMSVENLSNLGSSAA